MGLMAPLTSKVKDDKNHINIKYQNTEGSGLLDNN